MALLSVGVLGSALRVQAAGAGLYTADQAKRGETVYQGQCVSCHGSDLDGIGQAPPLHGDDFLSRYTGEPIDALFSKIKTSMPATSPGSLTPAQTADVLAYVLSSNKYAAGT
ncbi:MAG: cytochrome c, partial [Granulicella sp.]